MVHSSVIYQLKKSHGRNCLYRQKGEIVVDPTSGSQHSPYVEYAFNPIVLPVRLILGYVGTQRSKDHPSGAFYNRQDAIALVERTRLPKGMTIADGDDVIIKARFNNELDAKYAVNGILDLHGEAFLEIGLVRVSFDSLGEQA